MINSNPPFTMRRRQVAGDPDQGLSSFPFEEKNVVCPLVSQFTLRSAAAPLNGARETQPRQLSPEITSPPPGRFTLRFPVEHI